MSIVQVVPSRRASVLVLAGLAAIAGAGALGRAARSPDRGERPVVRPLDCVRRSPPSLARPADPVDLLPALPETPTPTPVADNPPRPPPEYPYTASGVLVGVGPYTPCSRSQPETSTRLRFRATGGDTFDVLSTVGCKSKLRPMPVGDTYLLTLHEPRHRLPELVDFDDRGPARRVARATEADPVAPGR